MKPIVIRQGEYLTQLAHDHGFDADAVWSHPKNAELATARKSPEVLAPGDVLYVPKRRPKKLALALHAPNAYVARIPKVKVALRLQANDRRPIANATCWVHGLGEEPREVATGGEGQLAIEVGVHIKSVRIVVEDPPVVFDVVVGAIDPIGELSGLEARLRQLGFLIDEEPMILTARELGSEIDDEIDQVRVRRAVAAFQREHGLSPTGDLDADTQSAIERAYGG